MHVAKQGAWVLVRRQLGDREGKIQKWASKGAHERHQLHDEDSKVASSSDFKNEMTILRRLQRGSRVTLGPIHDVKQDAKPLVCRQLVDKDHAIQEFASQGTPGHGKRDMLVKALAL